ncbi:hypothetical protein ACJX0J_013706, partial [Zea mays]
RWSRRINRTKKCVTSILYVYIYVLLFLSILHQDVDITIDAPTGGPIQHDTSDSHVSPIDIVNILLHWTNRDIVVTNFGGGGGGGGGGWGW